MKWQVTTPPASEPVAYGEAKAQARIMDDAERPWIEKIAIPAARATCEQECNLSLITQTITATAYDHHDAHHSVIRLPRGPVQSITSVTDFNGTVDPSQYSLERFGLNDFVKFTSDRKYPVVITYVAGYGNTPASVPPHIRAMILAHVSFLYDNRGADVQPTAIDRLYRQYRSFAQ